MTLEFDINETGTFNVVYNASISIPNTTVTVSGNIQFAMGSEVNSTTVTLSTGSTLMYKTI